VRHFAQRVLVSFALFVGLLAAGEMVSYLLLSSRTWSKVYRFEYRPYVTWRRMPGGPGNADNVDAEGWRSTLHSHCDANEYTIWMLGGSGVWGTSIQNRETIPSLLAERFEAAGHPVCMKNYGQPAWVSTQEVIQLLLELKRARRKPNLVIFYDGSMETEVAYMNEETEVHSRFGALKPEFERLIMGSEGFGYLRQTNTYLALQWFAGSVIPGVPRPPLASQQIRAKAERTIGNYFGNMDIVDALAARYGFQYLWFWEPSIQASPKHLTPDEALLRDSYEAARPGADELIRTADNIVRSSNRPHLVYLGDILKDHPEGLFLDLTHFGLTGNKIIVDRMLEELHKMSLYPWWGKTRNCTRVPS
jgi:hypothetical protein